MRNAGVGRFMLVRGDMSIAYTHYKAQDRTYEPWLSLQPQARGPLSWTAIHGLAHGISALKNEALTGKAASGWSASL